MENVKTRAEFNALNEGLGDRLAQNDGYIEIRFAVNNGHGLHVRPITSLIGALKEAEYANGQVALVKAMKDMML